MSTRTVPILELTEPGGAERRLVRVETIPPQTHFAPYFDWETVPTYTACGTKLGQLLRACMSAAARAIGDENGHGFLPSRVLELVMTEDVVRNEIQSQKKGLTPQTIIDVMFRGNEATRTRPGGAKATTYVLIFAILALVGKLDVVDDFVGNKNGPSDQDLPLTMKRLDTGEVELWRREEQRQMRCFDDWSDVQLESFHGFQWRLLVPIFALNNDRTIKHYKLDRFDVLPWWKTGTEDEGGEGIVTKVRVHPLCHDYHELLKSVYFSPFTELLFSI